MERWYWSAPIYQDSQWFSQNISNRLTHEFLAVWMTIMWKPLSRKLCVPGPCCPLPTPPHPAPYLPPTPVSTALLLLLSLPRYYFLSVVVHLLKGCSSCHFLWRGAGRQGGGADGEGKGGSARCSPERPRCLLSARVSVPWAPRPPFVQLPLCHLELELGHRVADLFANLEQYTQWKSDGV